MAENHEPTSTPGSGAMGRPWVRESVGATIALAASGYFYANFDQNLFQPSVDAAWLVATVTWLLAFWRSDVPSSPRLRQPYWFYLLYAAALLPFCTNWRWAMTGDTLSWLFQGVVVHDHGFTKSTLSARGPDQFGFTQMLIHNAFMILIDPTIFWHRIGKIMVAVSAAAAIYTAFARIVHPTFALLVTACAVGCSVWIVYVHSPFPYYDGVAGAFALLAVALWVRRDPNSRRAWLTLGALSGFMLFLTMNGWFMALCIWGWFFVVVLARRLPASLFVLAAVTGLIVGGPMLYQWLWAGGGSQFDLVSRPAWTIEKVERFFREAVEMPYASLLYSNGAFGPQLPAGFRWMFVPGILLTPFFAKRYPGSRMMFGIYVVHLIGLVFTQGPYESVSPKRSLILIPMATYFAFLPLQRWIRSLWIVAPIVAAWAFLGISDIVSAVQPGILGYTLLDGAIEANQRFAAAPKVCLYLPGDARGESLSPDSELNRLYNFSEHLKVVEDEQDPACDQVLCYCSQEQCRQPDVVALGYRNVPMLNTNELRCAVRGAIAEGFP